jgi:5,6,7,8-tetrahydromethanopterin hydro-lyase
MITPDELDGRFGEAWAGEEPNGSHLNIVVARRGSPTSAAAAAAMADVKPGHGPFLACLGAGNRARPATIVRNKTTIDSDRLAKLTWGAAQLGIGQGVADAVAEGLIAAEHVDDLVLLVAAWIDPAARDHTALRRANRRATRDAIADAVTASHPDRVGSFVESRDAATNVFYLGD